MIGAKNNTECEHKQTTLFISYILLISWILLGAAIFSTIESPAEKTRNLEMKELKIQKQEDKQFRHVIIPLELLSNGEAALLLQRINVISINIFKNETATYGNITHTRVTFNESLILAEASATSMKWDVSGSIFFCMTVVTTIGYGSTAPTTDLGKFVCVVYAIVGMPICFNLIAQIRKVMIRGIPKVHKRIYKILSFLDSKYLSKPSATFRSDDEAQVLALDKKIRRRSWWMTCLIGMTCYYTFVLSSTALIHQVEGWNLLSTFYYIFITFTSIGFGDYIAAQNQHLLPNFVMFGMYRLFLSMVIFTGMAAASLLIHEAEKFLERLICRFVKLCFTKFNLQTKERNSQSPDEPVSKLEEGGANEVDNDEDGDEEEETQSPQSEPLKKQIHFAI